MQETIDNLEASTVNPGPPQSVVNLDHLFPGSTIGVCTLNGKYLGPAVQNFIDQLAADLTGFRSALWEQAIVQEAD